MQNPSDKGHVEKLALQNFYKAIDGDVATSTRLHVWFPSRPSDAELQLVTHFTLNPDKLTQPPAGKLEDIHDAIVGLHRIAYETVALLAPDNKLGQADVFNDQIIKAADGKKYSISTGGFFSEISRSVVTSRESNEDLNPESAEKLFSDPSSYRLHLNVPVALGPLSFELKDLCAKVAAYELGKWITFNYNTPIFDRMTAEERATYEALNKQMMDQAELLAAEPRQQILDGIQAERQRATGRSR